MRPKTKLKLQEKPVSSQTLFKLAHWVKDLSLVMQPSPRLLRYLALHYSPSPHPLSPPSQRSKCQATLYNYEQEAPEELGQRQGGRRTEGGR